MQPMLPGYAATELLGWHVRRKAVRQKPCLPVCGLWLPFISARTLLLIIVPMLVLARTGLVSPAILDSATTIDPTVALWGTRMTTGHMVSSWMTWMVCVAARFTWSLDSSSFSTWASISWENPSMSWSPGGSRIGEAAICTSPEVGRAAIALALHSLLSWLTLQRTGSCGQVSTCSTAGSTDPCAWQSWLEVDPAMSCVWVLSSCSCQCSWVESLVGSSWSRSPLLSWVSSTLIDESKMGALILSNGTGVSSGLVRFGKTWASKIGSAWLPCASCSCLPAARLAGWVLRFRKASIPSPTWVGVWEGPVVSGPLPGMAWKDMGRWSFVPIACVGSAGCFSISSGFSRPVRWLVVSSGFSRPSRWLVVISLSFSPVDPTGQAGPATCWADLCNASWVLLTKALNLGWSENGRMLGCHSFVQTLHVIPQDLLGWNKRVLKSLHQKLQDDPACLYRAGHLA